MSRFAQRCISDLDDELEKSGELIKIARLHDAPDGGQVSYYCEKIPAKVVLAQPQEVMAFGANGAIQDTTVVISPTRLLARKFPMPPQKDDRIWLTLPNGRELVGDIETIVEQRIEGVVVRYDMKTRS